MRGRFQRRGVASALIISAAAILVGDPTFAQQTGNAARAQPTPPSSNRQSVAPPIAVPGPPAPPRDPNLPSVITNPSWVRTPSPEYPTVAAANGVTEGQATLRCTALANGALSGCVVVEEMPDGQGFGAATIAAARRARLSPRTVDGAAEGASVQFTIRSIAPVGEPTPPPSPPSSPLTITEIVPVPAPPQEIGSAVRHLTGQNQPPGPPPAPARPSIITQPSWARPPQPEYTALAMANGVTEGRAVIRCRVLRTGFLTNCEIAQETPTGQGFGAAALAAAAVAQISRRSVEGAADNATANIPIRFVAAD